MDISTEEAFVGLLLEAEQVGLLHSFFHFQYDFLFHYVLSLQLLQTEQIQPSAAQAEKNKFLHTKPPAYS